MPKIRSTKSYDKKLIKFRKKHPELRSKYALVIELLALDPFSKSLAMHKLKGNLSDLYAVSLNFQYRITLLFEIKDDEIILINIGTHDQSY